MSEGNAAGPFPQSLFTKLTYADEIALAPTIGSYSVNTFSANSLFDPDVTGVGHQPAYYDTLCGASGTNAPYAQYCVNGCAMDVLFRNLSNFSVAVAVSFQFPGGTAPIIFSEARESPTIIVMILGQVGSANAMGQIKFYRNMRDLLGVKDIADNQHATVAYNANPVARAYASIVVYNLDGTVTGDIYAEVRATYFTKFFYLNKVSQS